MLNSKRRSLFEGVFFVDTGKDMEYNRYLDDYYYFAEE